MHIVITSRSFASHNYKSHRIKWYQALIVGISVSAIIEFSQLIFMRGLFEWDDMIHNGLGCMMGGLLTNIFLKIKIDGKYTIVGTIIIE